MGAAVVGAAGVGAAVVGAGAEVLSLTYQSRLKYLQRIRRAVGCGRTGHTD